MSARFTSSYSSSCHLWLLVVLALVHLHLCLPDQKYGDILCMDNERQALFQFKHGLIDEANRLASWIGDKSDCCKWTGIFCDNITGHVHEIHLRGLDGHLDRIYYWNSYQELNESLKQMLGGHLSPSLLKLKQLKYLDMSCNDFKGLQIPSFIGSLKNLRYLNLSQSKFGGTIPPQIGNLSEIRVLSLGMIWGPSVMTMSSLHSLSSLRWLHHLDMGSVDLSKATDWFQVINTLPSLVTLDLSYCQLSDLNPHVLSFNVTSISVLDVSGNKFGETSISRWVFSLTSLVSLGLSGCNFDHPFPSSIYGFHNLTSLETLHASMNYFMSSPSVLEGLSSNLKLLDISSCGISSSELHSLHNLTSLLTLDVSRNQLTKAIPNSFGNLCNLRDFTLSQNKFGNTSLTSLLKSLFDCESPSLESLFISFSGLSGPMPNSIGRLSSLKTLDLNGNRLNGSIPELIGQLSSMEVLYLGDNQLSGTLPVSLGQLSNLKDLDFSFNSLTGFVTEAHFAKLVSLKHLNGAYNNLTFKLQVANWIPPFQIKILTLKYWYLGPQFPLWLESQRDMVRLDISNTYISSPMPPESFWTSLPNLTYLFMQCNKIKGALTLGLPPTLNILDLSFNVLTGKLPSISKGSLIPLYLDLSNNNFEGSLRHLLCSGGVQDTQVLYLGNNYLSGVIPECWENWPSLQILTLENNNLYGQIPTTLGSVHELQLLNMHGNKITGKLPTSLMNLSNLEILQLGKNKLVGSIPTWIGTKLTFLRILNLRYNNLDGNIPNELCYLQRVQILDLALNNLSGNIPKCFNNFSVLSGKVRNSDKRISFAFEGSIGYRISDLSIVSDTLVLKGQESTYDSILGLVMLMDLSSNNLSEEIPSELTTLYELKSLNLSRNQLAGKIPEEIGDMKALESFDLSVNKLSGELPMSLSRLNFLSTFNVSYNKLIGRVPVSTQLQSFNESNFFGNKLCGAPLSDHCVPVKVLPTNTTGYQKEDDRLEWELIISIALGFVIGFWIIVAPLMVSTSWRIAYFSFMSKLPMYKYLLHYK